MTKCPVDEVGRGVASDISFGRIVVLRTVLAEPVPGVFDLDDAPAMRLNLDATVIEPALSGANDVVLFLRMDEWRGNGSKQGTENQRDEERRGYDAASTSQVFHGWNNSRVNRQSHRAVMACQYQAAQSTRI